MIQAPNSAERRPTITVLVPTYRRPGLVVNCLAGLVAQSQQPDEVLLVVRADDTASRELLPRWPQLPIREVLVGRPGLVAARNAGLDAATGDIVAFIDDDAVPRSDWLTRLAAHYDSTTVGAVGGRDVLYHHGLPAAEPPRKVVGKLTWYGRFISLHHRGTGTAREVDFLKGVNMSFDRLRNPDVRVDQALRGRGAQVHEETSLCLQILASGQRVIYDPEILVDHYEADRGQDDERSPISYRARRDRHHNQTYVVVRYYPGHRAAVHVVYALLVGMADAPGLAITLRNMLRSRAVRGHIWPLVANVCGRLGGLLSGVRHRRRWAVEHCQLSA